MEDVLGYSGRRVVVTGAASGMGAAVARLLVGLGAEVHAVDVKKPDTAGLASFTECDLSDPEQIRDAAARVGAVVEALFSCAGLPNDFPPLDVMLVNFCGLRELTERVIPHMHAGGAICSIASVAGMAWLQNQQTVGELVDTPDFAAARAWCEADPSRIANAYGLSKEAINLYTAKRGAQLARDGIRMNCINPGPTSTPMMPHFEAANGVEFMREFPVPLGRHATAEEQAWPMLFLNSRRSSYVAATSLFTDAGFTGALYTGQIDFSALMPKT